MPLLLAVMAACELAGIAAQQVVHGVPARPGGLDQVSARQHVKQAAGPRHGAAEERGGGVTIKIGTPVQARQPERPRGGGIKVPVRPGEHGPHRGALISPCVKHVQPRLILQFAHQVGESPGRVHGGEFGGHTQRQRQPGALRGQRRGGLGVGVNPAADQPAQQADRIRHRQQVQVQALRTIPGHQAGQRVAAGHQRHAAGGGRQQRPYLLGRAGVVQDDQHPPAGQQPPVPRGAPSTGPGHPARERPGRAGIPPAPGRRSSARPGHSRAGPRTVARPGSSRPPDAPTGAPAPSCPPPPSRRSPRSPPAPAPDRRPGPRARPARPVRFPADEVRDQPGQFRVARRPLQWLLGGASSGKITAGPPRESAR